MTRGKIPLRSHGKPAAERWQRKEETAGELHVTDPDGIRSLQELAGNRAVSQRLRSSGVAFRAGSALLGDGPGDPYEQEARRTAEQVVRMPSPSERASLSEPDPRPTRDGNVTASGLDLGAGGPLPSSVTEFMEPRFEQDFSAVRIHTGGPAVRLARQLQARAFTTGDHIAFDHGAFNPQTPTGRELLAHELSHVVQQSSAASSGVPGGPPLVQRAPKDQSKESIVVPWRGTTKKSLRAFILTLLAPGGKATKADADRAAKIAEKISGDPKTAFSLDDEKVTKKTFEEAEGSALVLESAVVDNIARAVDKTPEVVRAVALAMLMVQPMEEALAEVDPASPAVPVPIKPLLLELAETKDAEAFAARLGEESDLPGKLDSLGPENKRGIIKLAKAHGLVEPTMLVPPPPNIKVRPPDTLRFTVAGERLLRPLSGLDDLLLDVNVAAWQGYVQRYGKHARKYKKDVSSRDWFSIRKLGPLEMPEKPSDSQIIDNVELGTLDTAWQQAATAPIDRIFELAGVAAPGAVGGEASLKLSVENEGTGVAVGIKGGKTLEGKTFGGAEASVKIDPSFGEGTEAIEFKAEGEVTESGTSGKVSGAAKVGPIQGELQSGSSTPKVGVEKKIGLPGELPVTLGAEIKGTELKLKVGIDPLAVDVSSDPGKGVVGAGISFKKEISKGTSIEGRLGFKAKLIALNSEFETKMIATAIDRNRPSVFEQPKGEALKETAKFKEGIPWGQLSDDEKLTNVVRHDWSQQRWDKKLAEQKQARQGGKP